MVYEVRMQLLLVTGSTAKTPEEAHEHVKTMLHEGLVETPLGTLEKDGLFAIHHMKSEVEVLSGKNEGDLKAFKGDGKVKSREREALEELMKVLYGNRKIIIQSDFEKPYELTLVELGQEKENYGQPQSQVHTHCTFDTDEKETPESIDVAVESFINHIIGDKSGLNWNTDFQIEKEEPHYHEKPCPECGGKMLQEQGGKDLYCCEKCGTRAEPVCPKCKDEGHIGSEACDCKKGRQWDAMMGSD